MPFSEKEKLLDDLLRDANYEAFRAEVQELAEAEFRARHRAGSRQRRVVYLALAASLALVGSIFLMPGGSNQTTAAPRSSNAPSIVAAQAFQKNQFPPITLIETTPLKTTETIRSLADRGLLISTPARAIGGIDLVQSDANTVDPVNDDQLIALFPNEAIGFITTARGKRMMLRADQGLFGYGASVTR